MELKNRIFFIPKAIFETWQAANDPEYGVGASLSDDGKGYFITVNKGQTETISALKALSGSIFMKRDAVRTFRGANPTIVNEASGFAGHRNLPIHPESQDLFEYAKLYDGRTATMNFNGQGDSEWVFPTTTLNSVADVLVEDDLIKLPVDKFGDVPIATWEPAFIYIDAVKIFMRTWPITSVVDNQNGTISVFMTIPPLI